MHMYLKRELHTCTTPLNCNEVYTGSCWCQCSLSACATSTIKRAEHRGEHDHTLGMYSSVYVCMWREMQAGKCMAYVGRWGGGIAMEGRGCNDGRRARSCRKERREEEDKGIMQREGLTGREGTWSPQGGQESWRGKTDHLLAWCVGNGVTINSSVGRCSTAGTENL